MGYLKLGIIHRYQKADENRVALHPDQFDWIDDELKSCLFFETGYGDRFNLSDQQIASAFGGVLTREELINKCDVILLPKPLESDLREMRKGQIVWGWPHCVQQYGITQAAIDQELTLIAWEAMNFWGSHGEWKKHVFDKNNEIAGYAGVQDALRLSGKTGYYGESKQALVIGTGAVSRGAVLALQGHGIHRVLVISPTPAAEIKDAIPAVEYAQFECREEGLFVQFVDGHSVPLVQAFAQQDIIVNAILQNPTKPMMYMTDEDIQYLKNRALIVDVSCDEGMGFSFARPTSFNAPMLTINGIYYYAVDHTPSLFWDSASWEISRALIPFLRTVLEGPEAWDQDPVIKRSIEMREGRIQNPDILDFQKREPAYPHTIRELALSNRV